MADTFPTFNTQQYQSTVELLLQIKGSKFRGKVTEANYTGKAASPVNQLGSVEMKRVTGRFQPRVRTDIPADRRWVYPVDYDLALMVDSFDQLKSIADPKGKYVEAAVNAAGRAMDYEVIQGMFGTNKTDETGSTSTTFTSGNAISVNTGGTNSLLNVAKIRAAIKKLKQNFVDFDSEEIYCAITAADNDNLLNEIQITSQDFNPQAKPVLQDGQVTRFLGVNFVPVELLESKASGTDDQSHAGSIQLPMWAKSGIHLGIWWDPSPSISQRTDLQGDPWQVALNKSFGGTRLEENRIVKIWSYR
jgi:hypothetical protein